jgi:superfamily I DNA and/or RNA helicase
MSSAWKKERHNILEKARIGFGTSSFLGTEYMRKVDFNLCICDEGGQAPDTGTVLALRDNARTLAMFGDPRQLPPFQIESDPRANSDSMGTRTISISRR